MLEAIVQQTLDDYQISHEAVPCTDELADTARFCEHYGYSDHRHDRHETRWRHPYWCAIELARLD